MKTVTPENAFEALYELIDYPSQTVYVSTKERNILLKTEAEHRPVFYKGMTYQFDSKSAGGGMWSVWMKERVKG